VKEKCKSQKRVPGRGQHRKRIKKGGEGPDEEENFLKGAVAKKTEKKNQHGSRSDLSERDLRQGEKRERLLREGEGSTFSEKWDRMGRVGGFLH